MKDGKPEITIGADPMTAALAKKYVEALEARLAITRGWVRKLVEQLQMSQPDFTYVYDGALKVRLQSEHRELILEAQRFLSEQK